ncbi:hypothetical protein L4V52_006516 [Pseudomonas aeruginosa]
MSHELPSFLIDAGELLQHVSRVVIFRRRLHQLIGRNGCCAASS